MASFNRTNSGGARVPPYNTSTGVSAAASTGYEIEGIKSERGSNLCRGRVHGRRRRPNRRGEGGGRRRETPSTVPVHDNNVGGGSVRNVDSGKKVRNTTVDCQWEGHPKLVTKVDRLFFRDFERGTKEDQEDIHCY